MRRTSSRGIWKQLDGLFRFGTAGQLSDTELLGRFVARRDEAAEAAFAALVERHGPMVLGVCRRVLGDRHEAEDAFQATFLVLTRKASAIARREQLANWLFGVACRTALGIRDREARREARERRWHAMSTSRAEAAGDDGPALSELRSILDEELARLPERYRGAVVLCELEGLSRRAAAQRLGIPQGTLASRLARAKDVLRHRLVRRGMALSAIALDAGLAREAGARTLVVSSSLVDSTIRAATRIAAGASLAEVASTSVASLTQGVLKAMLLTKTKGVLFGLATAAVLTTGVGVLAQTGPGVGGRAQVPASPDSDRLGVLERKLDQILEALGGSRPAATTGRGGPVNVAPDTVPAGVRPDASTRRGYSIRFDPEKKHTEVRPDGADNITGPGRPDAPTLPEPPGRMGLPGYPPGASGASRPLAARMDTVEQRLAELERRIGALEDGNRRHPGGSAALGP